MPGAKGHLNERGPREIFGHLTITPKVKRQLEHRDRSRMNRRTQIMQSMGVSGGTQAPRRKQIREALAKPGSVPPQRFPQVGPRSKRPMQGASLSPPVPLGKQLQGRVQSGAIDRSQALRTARQRQTLKKAFGPNWRSKVYYGGGAKEIGEGGPFASRQIAAERAKGLARAKRKLY